MELLNITDKFTIGYLVLVFLIILIFSAGISNWIIFAVLHILAIAVILLLIKKFEGNPSNKILKFLRYWYPAILYTFLYEETGYLNHIVFPQNLDIYFQNIEYAIFRYQLSVRLSERFPYLWLKEILSFFYFSYYLFIPILGIILYIKKLKEFLHFLFAVSFTFYFCYLIYIFVPVVGPLIWCPPKMEGKIFVPLMDFIYAYAEKPGAAFPSSHVAVALVVMFFSYKYTRKLFPYFMVDVALLSLATVYCRYHYAIDIVAGIITGVLCCLLADYLYRKSPEFSENR